MNCSDATMRAMLDATIEDVSLVPGDGPGKTDAVRMFLRKGDKLDKGHETYTVVIKAYSGGSLDVGIKGDKAPDKKVVTDPEVHAFSEVTLPLGAYQTVSFISTNLGEQFTESGDRPRTLVATIAGLGSQPYVMETATVLLTEQAQEHMIAILQANLDGDEKRVRELIAVNHPEYGKFTP